MPSWRVSGSFSVLEDFKYFIEADTKEEAIEKGIEEAEFERGGQVNYIDAELEEEDE